MTIDAIASEVARATDWPRESGVGLGVVYLTVRDDDSFTFLSQQPSMTIIAADSPSGLAMIATMFSETFETPTYSPNGGVQFI
jgi:hypothetical protein